MAKIHTTNIVKTVCWIRDELSAQFQSLMGEPTLKVKHIPELERHITKVMMPSPVNLKEGW